MQPWRLEALVFCALLAATSLPAQTWTQTSAPTNIADGIASSADGTKLVAAGLLEKQIYTSTNSGFSWISNNVPNLEWNAVASSADGNTLVACGSFSSIYYSTNAGMNWLPSSASFAAPGLSSLAMSADGTKAVGVGNGKFLLNQGRIYTSTNIAAAWTLTQAPIDFWTAVACSADGNKIVAVSNHGRIVTSTNFGLNWATNNNFTSSVSQWYSIASSADGTHLVAAINNSSSGIGSIYTSSDSGGSWTSNKVPDEGWWYVASSADGEKLVADYQYLQPGANLIFRSTNGGLNWTSNNVPGILPWTCASSADGNSLVADAYNGIWTLQIVPSPIPLSLASSGGNLDVSWGVPSTNFVLQQSPDMKNWQTLTNEPALNLTNLQDEVFLPPTNGSAFFRLSQ
jgi:photosystem II stability/assembly factor-like uncharacterized protein